MMRRPRTTFLWISVVVAATVVSKVENKPHQYNNAYNQSVMPYNNQSGMPYNPALQQIGVNGMPVGVGGVAPMGVNGIPAVGGTGLMTAGHTPTMYPSGQSMYSSMPIQTNQTLMGQTHMVGGQPHMVGGQPHMVGGQMPMANPGLTQGVTLGFTPGLTQGVTPGFTPGFTPGVTPGVHPNMMQGNASLAYGQNLQHTVVPNASVFPAAQYGPTAPHYNNMQRYP